MGDGLYQGGMSGGIFCTGGKLALRHWQKKYKSIIPHSRNCALSIRDRTGVVPRCSLAVAIAHVLFI